MCVHLKHTASYDSIAELYNDLWEDWYLPAALPALENLLFSKLSRGASVLDVCCGCGHVTEEVVQRGYRVTGTDLSTSLLSLARRRLPTAQFFASDVRQMPLRCGFDAALCTFDSLNHLLTQEELIQALGNVREAVRPGGLFVFDMNLEEAYFADLRQWHPTVREREVSLVRGLFDLGSGLARTDLIWFVQTETPEIWERRTTMVYERCYSEEEVIASLQQAGWSDVRCYTAREAGVTAELGFGRVFFSARV